MVEPTFDQDQLREALRLAGEIYSLHEGGEPYAAEVQALSRLVGHEISMNDVCGAFGSIDSEDWAHDLVLASRIPPENLSDEVLMEMIQRVSELDQPEWLSHWHYRCLERATGCDFIELLGTVEEMRPEQLLELARRSRRRVFIPPPPSARTE